MLNNFWSVNCSSLLNSARMDILNYNINLDTFLLILYFRDISNNASLKSMMTKNNLHLDKYVTSACEEWIRDEVDEDMFCFNHNCKIILSIVFARYKGLFVLTCSKHNGGTKLLMLHPSQWKNDFQEKSWPTFPSSHTTSLIETSAIIKLFNHISDVPSNCNIKGDRKMQYHKIQKFPFQIYSLYGNRSHINKKSTWYPFSLEQT